MEMLSVTSSAVTPSRRYHPLNHYDYETLDATCGCDICSTWRNNQSIYYGYVNITAGHKRSCKCEACRMKMKSRSAHLAAMNRRDLYCEGSWHASLITNRDSAFDAAVAAHGSGMAMKFMGWLTDQFKARNDNYWEIKAAQRALGSWVDAFTKAAVGSGIVVLPISTVASGHNG